MKRTLIILGLLVGCNGELNQTGTNNEKVTTKDTGIDAKVDVVDDLTTVDVKTQTPDASQPDLSADTSMDVAPDMAAELPIPSTTFCQCDADNPAANGASYEMCVQELPSGIGSRYVTGRTGNAPDAQDKGAPKGTVTTGTFTGSAIYPNVNWNYTLYVPAQYDPNVPASLFVLSDGNAYLNNYNATLVFDNLINEGAMPTTVAIFINPGTNGGQSIRRVEYDTPSSEWPDFLTDEFLPDALAGLNITTDPNRRAVGGRSSGGVAAFKSGWFRPDQFRLIYTTIGSWVRLNANGDGDYADSFPQWIRDTERKPLRVTLLSGTNDLDNEFGNWPTAHMEMTAAFDCAGYAYISEFGDSGHGDTAPIRERFADDLRWLFKKTITSP